MKIFLNNNGLCDKHSQEELEWKQIKTARLFLENFGVPTIRKQTKNSSYRLKHFAEDWGVFLNNEIGERVFEEYVSNGALIKAAMDLGYQVFPVEDWPNCFFNLKIPDFLCEGWVRKRFKKGLRNA